VLTAARDDGVLPVTAAERIAEERMAAGPWAGHLYPGLAATPGGLLPVGGMLLVVALRKIVLFSSMT